MILGIDHLQINTSDITNSGKGLLAGGYSLVFQEKIKNNIKKKLFLNAYHEHHKIAYFESTGNNFPVELTDHIDNVEESKTPISFRANTIYLKIKNIKLEQVFWQELLSVTFYENSIKFHSFLPKRSFNLKLIPTHKKLTYYLNTNGCTSIALITCNIYKVFDRLIEKKLIVDYIDPWKTLVNGKPLTIGMLRTHNGIIVELIQLEKKG